MQRLNKYENSEMRAKNIHKNINPQNNKKENDSRAEMGKFTLLPR